MNSISDAHASASALMHHHHRHLQNGAAPFPAAPFAADAAVPAQAKQRPGLPPTPPTSGSSSSFHALGGQGDVCMDDAARAAPAAGLPPRKAHRRSRSDVPFGYFQTPSSPQPAAPKLEASWALAGRGGDAAAADDLFNAYLNLEGLDGLNSSDERHDEGDSRGSSMKTNGAESSENESEECAAESRGFGIRLWADGAAEKREGLKRAAAAETAPPAAMPAARHARSLSMDSLIGKLNFAAAADAGQRLNGVSNTKFSLDFGSGEFTPAEMKKIMADERLAEMALADPKRVKRVLANRQSAARSKERKMRYIAELEQKVQILQTEATTLSAQLTLLQRDSAGLVTQNSELKFRLQAMEQQAQLRDALNEALTGEVQRLKLARTELGDSCSSNNLAQQIQVHSQNQMFQLQQQQQQSAQIPFYQLQQPQQNGAATNHDPRE